MIFKFFKVIFIVILKNNKCIKNNQKGYPNIVLPLISGYMSDL